MRRTILLAAIATSLSGLPSLCGLRGAAAQSTAAPAGDAETAAPVDQATAPAGNAAPVGNAGSATVGVSPGAAPGTAAIETADPATIEAQRAALWASREMTEAREWVLEYGRRSRQLGEDGAIKYLARVQRLPLPAMRTWLAELTARRARLAQSSELTQTVRQRMVAQTFERLQGLREAQQNAALDREQAAEEAGHALLSQRQFSEELSAMRQASRSDYLSQMYYGRDYSYLAFPPWRMRAAAAASLPGDLPPGDPRNFLREVPIDANGNLVSPGAVGGAAAAAGAAAGVGPGGGANVGAGAGGGP